ncbi:MBL fold metallo-hydrolase [Nocardioides humilatus]|uniref:MBL fold metallo-hydrolase n=1 Tax=Nocardioides humilatus TaxID=2607660 RepID=A0A5B1LL12_9ACTN|nr:MBL fold metallo-hydrolase [Nocardioides humilatus]KAA1420317.1 MBL fold metallo-hydrolase [Nocardioides humilatus]
MQLTRVDDRVHVVTGTNVNWALVTEGDAVTVVDAGYPGDAKALLASLDAIGRRPEDVEAVVLTHAHLDHMGGIPALRARHRASQVPVFTGEEEARHARREYLEQITPLQMLQQCRHHAGRRWVRQTLGAVLPKVSMSLTEVTGVAADVPLDIPGGLVPVATPGHTTGHTAWLLPVSGVLFTGDALVTAHPLSRLGTRPQLLPGVFNEDEATMRASLEAVAHLAADTIVPGHGPHQRGSLAAIVAEAVSSAG